MARRRKAKDAKKLLRRREAERAKLRSAPHGVLRAIGWDGATPSMVQLVASVVQNRRLLDSIGNLSLDVVVAPKAHWAKYCGHGQYGGDGNVAAKACMKSDGYLKDFIALNEDYWLDKQAGMLVSLELEVILFHESRHFLGREHGPEMYEEVVAYVDTIEKTTKLTYSPTEGSAMRSGAHLLRGWCKYYREQERLYHAFVAGETPSKEKLAEMDRKIADAWKAVALSLGMRKLPDGRWIPGDVNPDWQPPNGRGLDNE